MSRTQGYVEMIFFFISSHLNEISNSPYLVEISQSRDISILSYLEKNSILKIHIWTIKWQIWSEFWLDFNRDGAIETKKEVENGFFLKIKIFSTLEKWNSLSFRDLPPRNRKIRLIMGSNLPQFTLVNQSYHFFNISSHLRDNLRYLILAIVQHSPACAIIIIMLVFLLTMTN